MNTIPHPLWFVVKRADLAADLAGHDPLRSSGDRVYQGIDRMAWYDVQDAYIDGTLPPACRSTWEEIYRSTDEPWCVTATRRRATAVTLLNATPQIRAANEVVCAAPMDCQGLDDSENMDRLGFDPLYLSSRPYSLLTPLFQAPTGPLSVALGDLGSAGLFESPEDAIRYGALYRELADPLVNLVEDLPLLEEAFHVVSVWRPLSLDLEQSR